MTTALTTTGVGLHPSHPAIWRLDLTIPGAHLYVYSLTRPSPPEPDAEDPHAWRVVPVPDESFRRGYPNPRIGVWPDPATVLAHAVTEVPTPGSVALRTGRPGRPTAMTDEELVEAMTTHARTLARRFGPKKFPRTLEGDVPGYSQSHLIRMCADDPDIRASTKRLRVTARTVLAVVRDEWESGHRPTAPPSRLDARYAPPPGLLDEPLTEAVLADPDADPAMWEPILRRWVDALDPETQTTLTNGLGRFRLLDHIGMAPDSTAGRVLLSIVLPGASAPDDEDPTDGR
jgi:hypothetical protein